MRIEGWHIDGFGVWHDAGVTDLGDGVTVFLGENEAGKTTLLAFLRAMLFGFPDKRSRENPYPPLAGGRHGGRIMLRDDGGVWTVSRFADKRKEVGVTRPDGGPADEDDLRRLLSGVDAGLFTSVFAFSLAELQQFATLDAGSVRERIFSVGISGAGQSARAVLRHLSEQEGGLLKQRNGQAVINDLVRGIQQAEEAVRLAEDEAGRYPALRRAEDEQSERIRVLDETLTGILSERRRYEAYISLRPDSDDVRSDERLLGELPAPADAQAHITVKDLVGRLRILSSREEALPELHTERATAALALERQQRRLGPEWTVERIRGVDDAIAARDAVRGWQRRLQESAAAAENAERDEQAARQAVAELTADHAHCANDLPSPEPPPAQHLTEREVVLRSLRSQLRDLQAAERQDQPRRSAPRRLWLMAAIAALLALAAAVAAAVAGAPQLALGLSAGAVLLGVVAALVFHATKAARIPDSSGTLGTLRSEVAAGACALGLNERPSEGELNALEAQLSRDRSERIGCDGTRAQLRQMEAKLSSMRARLALLAEEAQAARAAAAAEATAWDEWLATRGLPRLTPDGVLELFEGVRLARDAHASLQKASNAIAGVESEREAWSGDTVAALRAAGLEPEPAASRLETALLALDDALTRRASIMAHKEGCEQRLRSGLTNFANPEAAARELDEGDPADWGAEIGRLDAEGAEADAQRTAAIEERRDARRSRETLEASADVPTRQAELESLRAELARAAHQYRVVTTAAGLVRETLRSYVRDRQPGVLERASTAFTEVTGGRFRAVVQEAAEDADGIVVEQWDGTTLTPDRLSRGTCEQLYLAIRLALVGDFASRGQALPLIMDDCLVNFDPQRAAAMARLVTASAAAGQCLFFTCHPSTADRLREADPAARLVTLPGRSHGLPADAPPLFAC